MPALDADLVRGVMGGIVLVVTWALYVWRMLKSNPGDKFIDSGSAALMVCVVVIASSKILTFPIGCRNA